MAEKVTARIGSQEITLESGKIAKQADGAVLVQMGETIVLVCAVAAAKARPGQGFFPLTVDYREKASSAGRFPGGYFKREGRPTEKEILTCRITDRPIRPLFPKGWMNEVQVVSTVLSADGENDPDVLSILGASAALMISDIPWAGPLGALRVGRVGGEFVANPTHTQMEDSDLDLIYVGNKDQIVMFEGAADEISEEDFLSALKFAQDQVKPLIDAQDELRKLCGKEKREVNIPEVPAEIISEAKDLIGNRIVDALLIKGKLEREKACAVLSDEISEKILEKFGEEAVTDSTVKETFYQIQKMAVRNIILNEGKRLDGRQADDLRSVTGEVGIFPRTHGSSLFTRGETQAIATATLATSGESQNFDSYTGGSGEKHFMLHYNFPNYSVGETGRIMGPGRREIGHGALAERSLLPVVPKEEFAYAIRIVCEITESNGSSSMASVCSGSLALMDAGVPITRPVAGISIGLCSEVDSEGKMTKYKILTDIMGWEDAFCDMDCKIAGTEKGITGFQLDLKLKGVTQELMSETLEKAHKARISILKSMEQTIASPREEMSPYAPRIESLKINPEKIGMVIGPGGKNIKRLVEETGCEINIEDDGTVNIYSVSPEGLKIAKETIEAMTADIEVGKLYRGKVVSVKDFGCFIEVLPGKEGLCHISELANFRVKKTDDIVKDGDSVWVKCIGVDDKGRVKLSRRAAMEERSEEMAPQVEEGAKDTPQVEEGDKDTKE